MNNEGFPDRSLEKEKFKGEYCDNKILDGKLKDIIAALEEGDVATLEELGVKKMIKNVPTLILKANNEEGCPKRYNPGEQLVTYNNEFDDNGLPVQET